MKKRQVNFTVSAEIYTEILRRAQADQQSLSSWTRDLVTNSLTAARDESRLVAEVKHVVAAEIASLKAHINALAGD